MYFVVETKGTIEYLGNRPTEAIKIKCGKKHFEALGNDVKFTESDSYDTFMKKIEIQINDGENNDKMDDSGQS